MATLGYLDGPGFAARATAPALYSAGPMDDVGPPSTVFVSYNRYAGHRQLRVHEFDGQERGEAFHAAERLAFPAMATRRDT